MPAINCQTETTSESFVSEQPLSAQAAATLAENPADDIAQQSFELQGDYQVGKPTA